MLSIQPPWLSLYTTARTASVSDRGMFTQPSAPPLSAPSSVVEYLPLKPAANLPCSGLRVMSRRLPDWELAPNRVPWGPDRTSIRSRSAANTSRLRPPIDTGCSSTYSATPG